MTGAAERSGSIALDRSATARSASETGSILGELQRHDLLLRNADGSIRGAYPFTEAVIAHTVTFPRTGRTLHTMCAVDALGAGAMVRENAVVRSRCHACDAAIYVDVSSDDYALDRVMPVSSVLWVGFRPSSGCLAETLCPEVIFFRSERHFEQWRSAGNGPEGQRLSIEEGL